MGSGFSKMRKQARLLQDQMEQMRGELEKKEATGSAGNGLVKIVLTGEKQIKKIEINPECVDPQDVEGLQDLIIGAFADASKKLEEETAGLSVPGLGL